VNLTGALPLLAVAVTAACHHASVHVLARGVIPYGVATTADAIITIELSERFALVVRRGDAVRRLDLGPAELDLRALATVGDVAYVGSDAGVVEEIDLRDLRRLRSFAIGAPVRALAADPEFLISVDATQALCLRRRRDGALLQCAITPWPIGAAVIHDRAVWMRPEVAPATGPATPIAWTLPSLTPMPAPSTEKPRALLTWNGGTVQADGGQLWWNHGTQHRKLTQLASAIRAIVVTSTGELVVTAWPQSLDDPTLVLITQ
jgi:hypothetical protein